MSLVTWLKGRGKNGFGAGTTAEEVTAGLNLSGKTYLVTGGNSGLGMETLRVLGLRGAHMAALSRNVEVAAEALQRTGAEGIPFACDLSEPTSVRTCIAEINKLGLRLDGIICNAGVMALPTLSVKHGLEMQFLTNHMGHFILVTGLLDRLTETGRVVMLSSSAHQMVKNGIDFENLDGKKSYNPWAAYGRSKLANLLFAKQLAKRFEGSHQTANAVHPGVIRTNVGMHMNAILRGGFAILGPVFLKTAAQGAATQCYVATHPEVAATSGLYFADCNPQMPSHIAEDRDSAARLWQESETLASRI